MHKHNYTVACASSNYISHYACSAKRQKLPPAPSAEDTRSHQPDGYKTAGEATPCDSYHVRNTLKKYEPHLETATPNKPLDRTIMRMNSPLVISNWFGY